MADESPGTVLAPDALNPQSFLVIENGQVFRRHRSAQDGWRQMEAHRPVFKLVARNGYRQTLRLGRGHCTLASKFLDSFNELCKRLLNCIKRRRILAPAQLVGALAQEVLGCL